MSIFNEISSFKALLASGLAQKKDLTKIKQLLKSDSYVPPKSLQIKADNPYLQMVSREWGEALKESLYSLPRFSFDE